MDGTWAFDGIVLSVGFDLARLEAGERAKRNERDTTLPLRVHLVPAHEETGGPEVRV